MPKGYVSLSKYLNIFCDVPIDFNGAIAWHRSVLWHTSHRSILIKKSRYRFIVEANGMAIQLDWHTVAVSLDCNLSTI